MSREDWVGKSGYYEIPTESGPLALPSVTTILNILNKPALVNWAKKVTAEYAVQSRDLWEQIEERDGTQAAIDHIKKAAGRRSEKAMDVGSAVHSIIEGIVLGIEPEYMEPPAIPYVEAFQEFVTRHGVEFVASEITVFDPDLGFAGTCDAIAAKGDRLGVLDWKTRQDKTLREIVKYGAYETERMQVAAYAKAPYGLMKDGTIIEMPDVQGASVVMLTAVGLHVEKVDLEFEYAWFQAALALWKNQKEDRS
jgi:hypothetical protein